MKSYEIQQKLPECQTKQNMLHFCPKTKTLCVLKMGSARSWEEEVFLKLCR